MTKLRQVIDEAGSMHTLTKRIGVGGQGEVWLTQGSRRVVKLLFNTKQSEEMRRQFAFVRRLDLKDLHVAKPISVLKAPHVGYVAEFLDGMVPIEMLISAPHSSLLRWHIETGGLRRRLRLLAHAGEALMGLHGRGIVYADVSHNNVFISENSSACEAWLIDLDNLTYEEDHQRAIHTRGYGAPEVVAGYSGCTSLSDSWSFAVLVWQTLTLTHPFVGDAVNDSDPENEDRAFRGDFPWIGHSTDVTNRCSTGLPADYVLGPKLTQLARTTFENGLKDRKCRPSISTWVERLHRAADKTIICQACGGTYFVTHEMCPWCNEPKTRLYPVQLRVFHPENGLIESSVFHDTLPIGPSPVTLTRRNLEGISGVPGHQPLLELVQVERGIGVRVAGNAKAFLRQVSGDSSKVIPVPSNGVLVPWKAEQYVVMISEPNQLQRVVVIGGHHENR